MHLNDYTIDSAELDWAQLLANWAPPLPESLAVWFANRFGDIFVIPEYGSVQLLDIQTGMVRKIAEGRDDFAERIDSENNAREWLLMPLVDRCMASGLTVSANQCYGFKIPPILGGSYENDNIVVKDMVEHYPFMADSRRK